MAIDHWLDERGQQAIEKMGWPITLSIVGGGKYPRCFFVKNCSDNTTPFLALALLRDHALEYLVAFATRHACCLSIASPGSGYEHWYIAIRGHGRPVVEIELADYDAALVATIHAVEN